jgi:hypothetical protein
VGKQLNEEGTTMNVTSIKCGNCGGNHPSVNAVKACHDSADRTSQPTTRSYPYEQPEVYYSGPARREQGHPWSGAVPASQKQLDFIQTLIAEKEVPGHENGWLVALESQLGRPFAEPPVPATLGKFEASQAINKLIKLPARYKSSPTRQEAVARSITQDGMYRNPSTGEIFKVQFNRASGDGRRLYAKQLIGTTMLNETNFDREPERIVAITLEGEKRDDIEWSFEYTPGAMRTLKPEWRMSIEEAKQFGALYGTCVRCSRTLTKEESIERAMGPVCAGKANWA